MSLGQETLLIPQISRESSMMSMGETLEVGVQEFQAQALDPFALEGVEEAVEVVDQEQVVQPSQA
jgi:hypothetical protein